MIRLEVATKAHIEELSPRIREIDRKEIWRAAHITAEAAIESGLTDEAYALYFNDEIALIFGCKPITILSDEACPWMIASDLIERHPLVFLRKCKPTVDYWHKKYRTLINFADNENETVKKWVAWLGFTVYKPAPYGIEGALFCEFRRSRNV